MDFHTSLFHSTFKVVVNMKILFLLPFENNFIYGDLLKNWKSPL